MGATVFHNIANLRFAIVSVISAGVVLSGGLVAVRAVRSGGAMMLIVGGALFLLNNLVWFGFTAGQMFMVRTESPTVPVGAGVRAEWCLC